MIKDIFFKKRKLEAGQSIIEATVSVGVVALIVVALVSVVTLSIRNAVFSKNKSLATKYVTEGLEAVRSIREKDWQELKTAADAGGTHGLINTSGIWTFDSAFDTPATGFTRKVEITGSGDSYQVVVTVSWTYGAKSFSSSSTTNFTLWKQ